MNDDNLYVTIQDCIDYLTEEVRQIDIILGGILSEDYKTDFTNNENGVIETIKKYVLKKQTIFKILLTLIQKTENI